MTESPGHQVATMTYGARFWVGVLLGWALIAFGIHSAFRTYQASNPIYSIITLVTFAVVNDLLLAPAIIIIGLALRRVVRPGPVAATALAVGLISIVVTAFSLPEIRHYGKDPALASSLQTANYATGLLVVVGVVWAVAAAVIIIRLALRHHSGRRAQTNAAPAQRCERPG